MLAWSIRAAQASTCFERIIVSTDDDEIAAIAQQHGAEVPFMRPEHLANDLAGTIPVMRHAVEWLNRKSSEPEAVCCLYATAPFVQARDLREGLRTLLEQRCDYAFSVTSFPFPIQRAVRITADRRIEMFQPEYVSTRSQDLEEAYHDAGQFYWGKTAAWLCEKPLFSAASVPVILPRHRVQDIDTQEDWERAEWLFKTMNACEKAP